MQEFIESQDWSKDVRKNKLYFAVSKLVNKIGSENYNLASSILKEILGSEKNEMLIREKTLLERLAHKKIDQNPYNSDYLAGVYDDRRTDLIAGILSLGEDFMVNFANNDKETHLGISPIVSDELYGYAMLLSRQTKEEELEERNRIINETREEINEFLVELESCEYLSESYKEKMKEGVEYVLGISNLIQNKELEVDFDVQALKSSISDLKNQEKFCQPLFEKIGLHHGIFTPMWVNFVKDSLTEQQAEYFIELHGCEDLFDVFDEDYFEAYQNEDLNTLIEIEEKFNDRFKKFIDVIDMKPSDESKIKNGSRKKSVKNI